MRFVCRSISPLFAAALLLCLIAPVQAYAVGLTMDTCAPGGQPWDLTVKLVRCVETSVMQATISMMSAMSGIMFPVTSALFVTAIIIFGVRIVGGERTGRAGMYVVRLAVVSYFVYNLAGFAGAVFAIESEIVGMVSFLGSPWAMIDNFLGKLIGFGPQFALFQGVLGLIGGALGGYSVGSLSIMIFGAGSSALITLLQFILNVVYTYLMAIIMLGFLITLSPIFVPFAVFFLTERYIKKLVDMIISIMIMPILLFAFTTMFIGIFDSLISQIFDTLLPADHDFRALWNVNNPIFSWIMPGDASLMDRLQAFQSLDGTPPAAVPPVQTNVNPFLRHGFNAGVANFAGLNFGPNEPLWMQKLAMKFVALWLFASLMKTMVSRIPDIAGSIAGSVIQIPLSATTPGEMLKNAQDNFNAGAGAIFGGGLGSAAGQAAARAAGGNAADQRLARQGGGVLGAIGGMMVTKRRDIQ